MTIQQAIEKAIEGGFNDDAIFAKPLVLHRRFGVEIAAKVTRAYIFSLPLFWQSLGKAMRWENESECPLACCGGICPIDIPMWQSQWHRFIDKLSNGVTAEQFFEEL